MGYIDKEGKEVIPLQYSVAMYFQDGLAVVMLNGISGYIHKNGTEYWEE